MQPFLIPNKNHSSEAGFTIIELLIVIILVGIMASLTGPAFMGMINRAKVREAHTITRGALQEAQREAIRKSRTCTVTLASNSISANNTCLPTGTRNFDPNISLTNNGSSLTITTIEYNHRGVVTLPGSPPPNQVTLVVGHNSGVEQRCLVVSAPLGLIRTGIYQSNACQ
jgi:prepilin-type N-terminal cleavage/methylation domain-containing protein